MYSAETEGGNNDASGAARNSDVPSARAAHTFVLLVSVQLTPCCDASHASIRMGQAVRSGVFKRGAARRAPWIVACLSGGLLVEYPGLWL